jgi:outer membrane biosynthesis protein TonB
MISIHPAQNRQAPHRSIRAVPLAVACSLLAHALAAVGLAFSPVGRLTEEPIAEVEFAGREGVVIIEASFAAAATPADPVVEIPRAEAPIEVTPQEARIEHRLYRQAPSQAIDFESPPVELSDFGETPPPGIRPAEIAADGQPAAVRPLAASLNKAAAEPPAVAVSPPSSAAPMTAGFETPASFAGNAPPVYPAMAVNNRWSGSVLLKLWIDEAGAVKVIHPPCSLNATFTGSSASGFKN